MAPTRGVPAAIANSAGSFALVTGHECAAAAPRNIRDNLAPGGRLIVGVEPPRLRAGRAPLRYWWHGDKLLTLTGHTEVDAVAQRTTSWNRYEPWRAGELIKTELEPFTLQWYGHSANAPRSGFPARDHPRRLPDRPAPGTGKPDVDIRSHTRLRTSAPGPDTHRRVRAVLAYLRRPGRALAAQAGICCQAALAAAQTHPGQERAYSHGDPRGIPVRAPAAASTI
jgi:hypothetical protein